MGNGSSKKSLNISSPEPCSHDKHVKGRHLRICPGCRTLLHRRSIHHPSTFRGTVKRDFEWGYGKKNGPKTWYVDFPVAIEGKRQSPINIDTSNIDIDSDLLNTPLNWKYDPTKNLTIENTGKSWTIMVNGHTSALSGGPLDDEYMLWQYHAHWGNTNDHGSEHTIDRKAYPAEVHFVHWNATKYHSPTEAVNKPDGLAVLGVFLEISRDDHDEFSKVCSLLNKIKYQSSHLEITNPIDVERIMPDNKSYWTYPGSLTTPPLLECVTWIVFCNPIKVSQAQIDSMRNLMFDKEEDCKNGCGEMMVNNYRQTVPVGDRKVKHCIC